MNFTKHLPRPLGRKLCKCALLFLFFIFESERASWYFSPSPFLSVAVNYSNSEAAIGVELENGSGGGGDDTFLVDEDDGIAEPTAKMAVEGKLNGLLLFGNGNNKKEL